MKGLARALRFAQGWKTGTRGVEEEVVEIRRGEEPLPGTLLRPRGAAPANPAWIILHGITRPGREHPTLLRFVRALAGSGYTVLVPEIPEWRDLCLAPEAAAETARAAVLHLAEGPSPSPERMGLMGFSFGVTQALRAAGDPRLARYLAVAAGFGGYCDLERTVHFLFRGRHEWRGQEYRGDPDPYGRWVVGGNYLPSAPGFEGSGATARALLTLAREAGDAQVGSWEEALDPVKEELEAGLPEAQRELFRNFAPPAGELPPEDFARTMVPVLVQAALARSDLMDPRPLLERISIPVRLIHGREDRLIPFTETLRLEDAFPPGADLETYLTGLFSHSRRDTNGSRTKVLVEQMRFVRMLGDLLGLV